MTGIKHTITSVTEEVLPDKPLGTAFEDLWLPHFVEVKTNTGATFGHIPVTWDGSSYDPNALGEQIITGQLHVEMSFYAEELEPTSTVKAIARITLIGDEPLCQRWIRHLLQADIQRRFLPARLFRRVSFRRNGHGRWRNG